MTTCRYQIVVLMWLGKFFSQRVLSGALEYLQTEPTVEVSLFGREMHLREPIDLPLLNKADGVINLLERHELSGVLEQLHVPVVSTPLLEPIGSGINVHPDYTAVAEMAVEHFRHAYIERVTLCSSIPRRDDDPLLVGLRESARRHGLDLLAHQPASSGPNQSKLKRALDRWLAALPKPVGICCDKDGAAQNVITACRELGIAVPGDIAVLGLGDNLIRCLRVQPAISSIALQPEEFGRRAASLMVASLDGHPAESVVLPPTGVVQRGSTDVVAIDDPAVARAARYLREHAAEPITIAGMVETLGLTRRSFQRRFKRATGRTPIKELIRLRVQLAKHRLAQTDAPIFNIAIDCGFGDQAALSNHFRRHAGMSPTAYRAAIRGAALTADAADAAEDPPAPGPGPG